MKRADGTYFGGGIIFNSILYHDANYADGEPVNSFGVQSWPTGSGSQVSNGFMFSYGVSSAVIDPNFAQDVRNYQTAISAYDRYSTLATQNYPIISNYIKYTYGSPSVQVKSGYVVRDSKSSSTFSIAPPTYALPKWTSYNTTTCGI